MNLTKNGDFTGFVSANRTFFARFMSMTVLVSLVLVTAFGGATFARTLPYLAHDLLVDGNENQATIQVKIDKKPKLNWFALGGPERLVIDLPDTRFVFDEDMLGAKAMISTVHYGALGEGHSRLIFTLSNPFEVTLFEIIEQGQGYQLNIELAKSSKNSFQDLLVKHAKRKVTKAAPKGDRLGAGDELDQRPFTIVIDPGHGGIDGGARGRHGTEEKTITLAFALELRKKLEDTGQYRVLMTRSDDKFIRLDDRVKFGRQNRADLFISIHADTIRYKRIRGATVYTISQKASDKISHAIAEQENLADAIAGVEFKDENLEVADILVDLARKETKEFSIRFARTLVSQLSREVELIKNPHRSAGFRVLTAPDVPSVLVELGYLSNQKDEKLMRDPKWREKAATSVAAAVALFAATYRKNNG